MRQVTCGQKKTRQRFRQILVREVAWGSMSVRQQWAFFFESMHSHVYGVKWSLWGVPIGSFLNFSKILIFGHFLAFFWSKLTPK
jgi:hypothetical protein